MLPLLSGAFKSNAPAPSGASPSASPDAKKAELDAQAKGYEMVLQREPDNQTALRGLLEVQIQRKDLKGAITALEKLAQLNPQESRYGILLGQAKQQLGDREGAAQAFRNILNTQPGNVEALQGMVGLLLQQNRPEAAIGLLQDTLKLAPQANKDQPGSIDVLTVQLILASVYAEQQRYEDSITVYKEAAKTNPTDFRPVAGQAIVRQRQGKPDEAKSLFETAVSLAPAQYKDQIKKLATDAQTLGNTPPTTAPNPESTAAPAPSDTTAPTNAAPTTAPLGTAPPPASPNPVASP